jgi:hypothetical protein
MIDVGITFYSCNFTWATFELGPHVFGLTLYAGIAFREYSLTQVDQHLIFLPNPICGYCKQCRFLFGMKVMQQPFE